MAEVAAALVRERIFLFSRQQFPFGPISQGKKGDGRILKGSACAAVPAEVAAALVSWDHSGEYPLPSAWLASGAAGFTKTFKLDEPEHAFIADHNVDGRILMPVRTSF